MPDNNKEKVVSSWEEAEKDDVVSSWEEAESSPKSTAPSKTGGESGAFVRPITPSTSTPTSASAGLKSASWKETANPLDSKFQSFKNTLPSNLKNTDESTYNLRGYWEGLGKPDKFDYSQNKEADGTYHANSRNPRTGEILKKPNHPTFNQALEEDAKMGYMPYISPDGTIYTFSKEDKIPSGFKPYSRAAAKPIDAVEQTKITKPKYEPNNFGEILKKAKIGVINPDLDEVVNQSKTINIGGMDFSVRDMDTSDPAPMQRNVPKKEVDQDIDLLVTRTNVVRKMRDQEIDKAKQLQLGLEQIKQKGANLNEQYKVNPTPELEAQLNQTVKDLQDTEKAYNRAAFAQDVYEKRIVQTSDSIKKLANDKVPDNFFSGFYSGMKDNLESRGKAYDLATMGKAEQIQYAKDQALKAPSIRVGDRVQWVANGEEKFDEPLKIKRISQDGSTAFILVNGVENQIPLEQLEKESSMIGEGGQMLGGVAPDILEAIGWSLAGLPFMGAASVSARQGAQQATEDFSRTFNEVKSKGLPSGRKDTNGRDIMREATDDEAYDIAIRAAGMGAATGAAEGLVGTMGGGKIIKAVANKARTQGGKIVAEKVLDTASDAAIAGGMQVTRNAFDQYQGIDTKITEGVGGTMLGEAVLSVPMNTFSGVGEYSKAKKETAVREVFKAINESKSNPYELQKLQSNLDVLKSQKLISDVDYNELNKKAEDYIRVVETIPTEVSDKQKAADLIIERDELEAKKESVDKAFQKPIDEKINAINDELVVMATPVELKKNTSPTNEKYGTINRNDGKGVVNLTKEEFEAEQANMQAKAEGTAVVEKPTDEQIAKDIKDRNFATFTYESESEVPEMLKDRISSITTTNGKTTIRVTLPKSEADYLLSQKATPEAIAGETIKTKTNEKNDEDGEQKRGKDGEENVPKILQSEGEDGGQKVDLQEKQVLGTEGAAEVAPTVEADRAAEVERLRAEEQKELNAAIPNADKYKTDGKVDRDKLTDPKDIEAFDEIYDRYDKLITAPKVEQTPSSKIDEIFEQFETVDNKSNSPSSRRDANRKMKELISSDPKIKLIFDNIKDINRQLEEQQLITKKGNCP